MRHTIQECLTTIEVSTEDLQQCENLEQEFSCIKKAYFKKVLVCHPDKGGDAAVFRQVHASFEVLRDMYDRKVVVDSFVTTDSSTVFADDTAFQAYADMEPQSWDYYYTAADEPLPLYRVEPAKTNRSSCKQKGSAKKCEDTTIEKNEVRIGSMDSISGAYGRWNHVQCWRVPSKVWLGMPDPCDDPVQVEKALLGMNEVLLSGFSELSPEQRREVVDHVMEKDEDGKMVNWARLVKRKPKNEAQIVATGKEPAAASASREVVPEGYHVPRERFVPPVPGGGAGGVAGVLKGKTVVLTGVFPEVGGGSGLNMGKAKVKAMVESFGGRVTSSISGKTDILIVGKDPGRCKVSKAEMQPKCKLISLRDLKEVMEGGNLEDIARKPMMIPNFSAGYPTSRAITAQADTEMMAGGYTVSKSFTTESSDAAEDKKPAAKRKKAEGDENTKPATNKRKKTAGGRAKTTAKKSKKKKTAEKAIVAKPSETEEFTETVTCDACGVDCTKQSWFVAETEQDFCGKCIVKTGKEGVKQANGVNV